MSDGAPKRLTPESHGRLGAEPDGDDREHDLEQREGQHDAAETEDLALVSR
jgi:hypothetical protein